MAIQVSSLKISATEQGSSEALIGIVPEILNQGAELNTYSSLFALGSAIKILAGYGSELADIFKGRVSQQAFKSSRNGMQVFIHCIGTSLPKAAKGAAPKPFNLVLGENILDLEMTHGKSRAGLVRVIGSSSYLPGKSITLAGMNATYNGNYRITAVEHLLENGEWMSTISIQQ